MTSELARRIAFTIGALLIYRLGSTIPVPGIDLAAWSQFLRSQSGDGLRSLMLFSSGVHTLAIFSLNLTPYISAAVVLQLATIVSSRVRALRSQGERGRAITEKITLCLTVLFASFQAYGVALAIEGVKGFVADPGPVFVFSTTITLTGGTLLLAWLSQQITMHGIGNGIALILLAGSTSALREPILRIRELSIRGLASQNVILGLVITIVAVTCLVVLIERAQRRFKIHFPKRQAGGRAFENLTSDLPVKVNPAGIIPALLASWIISVLFTIAFFLAQIAPNIVTPAEVQLITGRPLQLALYAGLILAGAFFYAAFLLDPEQLADRLREQGGVIASVDPGESTAAYIDYVLSRITVMGAAYLTLICLLPDVLMWYANVPVYFGGLSLLILVCTTLDFDAQLRGALA
jgi:preprotein translocase subunit SecY